MAKNRKEELKNCLKNISAEEMGVLEVLIDELVFLEQKMAELRQLPFIEVNPKNRAKQRSTPASREYKACSQGYMNGIRILISALNKQDSSAQDELLKLLEEYQ